MRWAVFAVYYICTLIDLTDGKSMQRNRVSAVDLPPESCAVDRYKCDNGKKCIPLKWICDGYSDCQDMRDERNCIPTNQTTLVENKDTISSYDYKVSPESSCDRSKFTCDMGAKCLPLTWLCDSIDDCVDKRDEHNCPAKKQGIPLAKAAEEAAITAAQEAKRAAFAAGELMKSAKEAALKARKAMKIVTSNL
ncbi:very low-density lipoprotein receptor [Exaiptasia diaphana]|uniref:Uncharacterized protein n=1 Tax=Exaiptasia diaphana TaxID=2652724 RepID=A0A913Y1Y9_EXADI|nr:very low-density lipoprotein receptor [Exaiptasia diaphana]KXJ23116.1 Low-density lipoprotein receptor-related protein 2 [Exaiptasia diaphana]